MGTCGTGPVSGLAGPAASILRSRRGGGGCGGVSREPTLPPG